MDNGERRRFWEDTCVGSVPFAQKYRRLYDMTFSKNITVAEVINGGWDRIVFRRTLWGDTLSLWENLRRECCNVTLTNERESEMASDKKCKFYCDFSL